MANNRIMQCLKKDDDRFTKLVKLVNDFNGFESIREMNAIIYLNSKLKKDFDYDFENFNFRSENGGDHKDIEWDVVSLELDDLITTMASVNLTEKGKLFSDSVNCNIDFNQFKNELMELERRLWPAAALYLYTNDFYVLEDKLEQEKIAKIVLCKYGFTDKDVTSIKNFLQRDSSTL